MDTPSGIPRIPWRTIAFWLIVAAATAWSIGFAAGLVARYFSAI